MEYVENIHQLVMVRKKFTTAIKYLNLQLTNSHQVTEIEIE